MHGPVKPSPNQNDAAFKRLAGLHTAVTADNMAVASRQPDSADQAWWALKDASWGGKFRGAGAGCRVYGRSSEGRVSVETVESEVGP